MKEQDTDYGPLSGLLGEWYGDRGKDIAPEPDGADVMGYSETIRYEAAGAVDNAETQLISAIHYHQIVKRDSDGEIFHNQTGYWMWDRSSDSIMHSFTIPRAVAIVAGGSYRTDADNVIIDIRAGLGDADWPISQSPFMRDQASTRAFEMRLKIAAGELSYRQTTFLDIYDREFEHIDESVLSKR